MTDILIIGGGASGLSAAVFAAERGAEVTIAERQPRVGKKLLATGNGRCNLMNTEKDWLPHYHGDPAFMKPAMNAFPPERIAAFFTAIGVDLSEEEEGRVYPAGNQAAGVLDALRLTAEERNVRTVCDFHVTELRKTRNGFTAVSETGERIDAKTVIFAVGSPAGKGMGSFDLKLAETLGHKIVPLRPALTQVKSKKELLPFLKGQRVKGTVTLIVNGTPVKKERGEILFQEYGLSGIAVMQLSGDAAAALDKKKDAVLSVDLEMRESAAERAKRLPRRCLEDFFTGTLPKRVGQAVLREAGIGDLRRPAGSLTAAEAAETDALLGGWRFPVTGVNGFESAQAAQGGLDCAEFDPETLESRKVPGFFTAGEALNVYGDCGGYNLRWAWASGFLAAASAAEKRKI